MAEQRNHIQGDLSTPDKNLSEQNELYVLIKACIAQNRSAQKKLYDRYSPTAYGIIRRYEYNEQAAQEILNDAFFKIITKLDQYSFQGAFEGWMRRIVVNAITDHLRKYIKTDQLIKGDIDNTDPYIQSNSISNISYKELLQLIHTLPETQRAVFNLHVFENLSHKEIAELLNINENNSRWHLNDARKRLKEKLKTIM